MSEREAVLSGRQWRKRIYCGTLDGVPLYNYLWPFPRPPRKIGQPRRQPREVWIPPVFG